MTDKQVKLLSSMTKKLLKEERTKEQAMETLVRAGILTKAGNFSKNYPTLKKIAK
jgi:hypothetical protein